MLIDESCLDIPFDKSRSNYPGVIEFVGRALILQEGGHLSDFAERRHEKLIEEKWISP